VLEYALVGVPLEGKLRALEVEAVEVMGVVVTGKLFEATESAA